MRQSDYINAVKPEAWFKPESKGNPVKEYPITELGYFTKTEAEAIKKEMDGKTYMRFQVGYSNFAGNYTLIIKTDYDETEEEIKNTFLHCCLSALARSVR